MTRKVVYNACYGGFGLSTRAQEMYLKMTGKGFFEEGDLQRHDPYLIAVVDNLGEKANRSTSNLRITEVEGPYRIEEYDGYETVKEPADLNWIY